MAWFRQTTTQYLHQCWPSCMTPYGVTTPRSHDYKISWKNCSHCETRPALPLRLPSTAAMSFWHKIDVTIKSRVHWDKINLFCAGRSQWCGFSSLEAEIRSGARSVSEVRSQRFGHYPTPIRAKVYYRAPRRLFLCLYVRPSLVTALCTAHNIMFMFGAVIDLSIDFFKFYINM